MKKLFVLLAAAGISFNAMAADDTGTTISSGVSIPTVAATGCSLLSESVTINLSPNVYGAYACNTVDNIIGIATCHPNGRKGDINVDCSIDPSATDYNAACADDGDGTGSMIVQGGLAYKASSRGGKVVGTNATNCVTSGGDVTAEAATAAQL